MAKKNEQEQILDVSKTEQFLEKNARYLIIGFVALIAIAAAFFYINSTKGGKEARAQEEAFMAEKYFREGNWQQALDGDGENLGFLDISSSYGNTKIGNLANYYAGVCYTKTGEFQNAVDFLEDFKPSKDPNVNGVAFMNLGDAHMELGNTAEGLKNYKKAANTKSDILQDEFIYRYGMALMAQQNDEQNKEAKKQFERIVEKFPNSPKVQEAKSYIAALS